MGRLDSRARISTGGAGLVRLNSPSSYDGYSQHSRVPLETPTNLHYRNGTLQFFTMRDRVALDSLWREEPIRSCQ